MCGGVAPYSLAGNGDIGLILETGARLCVLGAMIENIRVFRSCREVEELGRGAQGTGHRDSFGGMLG